MAVNLAWGRGPALVRALEHVSRSVYAFREESSLATRLLLVVSFAAFTGLSAQVSFPLPFTPVPVTGQVFAVLVSSSVLGRWLGPASQAAYLAIGAAGVPWFAPTAGAGPFTSGGWPAFAGASGGYLVGFLVAAFVVGRILDRGLRSRSFGANLLVLLLGVGVIYAIGSAQLALLLDLGPRDALLYGAVPFLPGDILKAVLAAGLLGLALPREYGPSMSSSEVVVDLGRADIVGVAGVLAVVWMIAGLMVLSGIVPADLVAYYVLSAAVSSAAVVSALGIRRAWGRRAPISGKPRGA